MRCEVFGEFAPLIPQQGWVEVRKWEVKKTRGRKRHGLVPDFLFMSGWGPVCEAVLAEVKVIGCCHSHYGPLLNGGGSAVQAYADKQTGAYTTKARMADRDFVGTPAGEVGPVETRLNSYGEVKGLVFGAFGEASEAVHEFVKMVADAEKAGGKGELAKRTGMVRRVLGVTAVKAQAKLLLERVRMVGHGSEAGRSRASGAAKEGQLREVMAADTCRRAGLHGKPRSS